MPQVRETNIHPCQSSQRCEKNSEVPSINRDSSPLSVLMLYSNIFQLLVEQTNLYYQQRLNRQARSSHQLPDITLLDMMTFIILALQMGHDLIDTLHNYWPILTATHCVFCILQTIHMDVTKAMNMTAYGNQRPPLTQ